jgi:hypothetical protein
VLIVVLILVALVCVGVPGTGALVYLTENNGPYHTIGPVCAVVNSPTSTPYKGGLPGSSYISVWTSGCKWQADGDFLFLVQVRVLHKTRFSDSISEATDWYTAIKSDDSDSGAVDTLYGEDTWGMGDQSYLSFSSKVLDQGKTRRDVEALDARTGNVVIHLEYLKVVQAAQSASYAEAQEKARAFRDPALALFRDITEDLR